MGEMDWLDGSSDGTAMLSGVAGQILRPDDYRTVPLHDATASLRDPEALRQIAGETGYLCFPALLPVAQVEALLSFVRSYAEAHGWAASSPGDRVSLRAAPGARFEGKGWNDPHWVELQRLLGSHGDFQALALAPALLAVLESLYGEPACVATANYCWIKLPGSPAQTTRPHQDSYYLPGCPALWTAWVPLVPIPLEAGPLALIPGSHLLGPWHHVHPEVGIEVDPGQVWATGPCEPGDVILFAASTVHCAWSNVSTDIVRVALDIRYEPRSAGETGLLRPVPFGTF